MDACDYLLQDLETACCEPSIFQAPKLFRGMRFTRTEDLKVAVEQFFASQGKGVKYGKGGSRQREFRCSGSKVKEGTREQVGCQAVIRATKQANNEWRISSMNTYHENCTGVKRKVSVVTAGRIASAIVAVTPNITGKELKTAIESQTGGTLSLRSAHRAKRVAFAGGQANLEESYSFVPSFLSKLATMSPGTYTNIEDDEDNVFRRCFVMLGKAVHVITQSVPKVFSLDEVSLEGDGVLITLSCKDSEDEVVLVATAIVEEGNPDGYEYMLRNCKMHPEMREFITSPETTCFSSGNQHVLAALAAEAPLVQHRWCLEHIISKIPAVSADCHLKLIDAARAPTFESFMECMSMVHAIEPATFKAVMSVPLTCWTHHASPEHTVILDQVTSHATELLSDVLDEEARRLPILDLLERVVRWTSRQFAERQIRQQGTRFGYTKFARNSYEREFCWGNGLTAYAVGYSIYVVQDPKCTTRSSHVTMTFSDQGGPNCACTCAFPARYKLPCRHVFAAAKVIARVKDCTEFIDERYRAKSFKTLCSDGASRIVCPSLSELQRDTSIRPPRKICRRADQLTTRQQIENRKDEDDSRSSVYTPQVLGDESIRPPRKICRRPDQLTARQQIDNRNDEDDSRSSVYNPQVLKEFSSHGPLPLLLGLIDGPHLKLTTAITTDAVDEADGVFGNKVVDSRTVNLGSASATIAHTNNVYV